MTGIRTHKKRTALITGITGQDGSFLAELLLEKGYTVYGIQRRSSTPNTGNIDHILYDPGYPRFQTTYGDLADGTNLLRIIEKVQPDEIYNLGAQSHVRTSFEVPEQTADVTGMGVLRILEIVRHLGLKTKFYQASSSEMFGRVLASPQNEKTPLNPQSPYAIAKTFAFYITKCYREGYDIFASNGILFNHESERRGPTFVTRKISMGLARVKLGLQPTLQLGNLDAKRDWGHARDYMEAVWRILQHPTPDDFVIATGETHTIREFAEEVGHHLGMDIVWKGKGVDECGFERRSSKKLIEIDPAYFRPTEVAFLLGDARKAHKALGWKPTITFRKLAQIMAEHDAQLVEQEAAAGMRFHPHSSF